jgi:hypothetical protein
MLTYSSGLTFHLFQTHAALWLRLKVKAGRESETAEIATFRGN